jgi:hypothetical protein
MMHTNYLKREESREDMSIRKKRKINLNEHNSLIKYTAIIFLKVNNRSNKLIIYSLIKLFVTCKRMNFYINKMEKCRVESLQSIKLILNTKILKQKNDK